jgi:hypothetical protein
MAKYLRAGALHDWTDASPDPVSLAREMETALGSMVQFPPDDKPEPRRQLFIALSTAVINHLANNTGAFNFNVDMSTIPPTVTLSSVTVHS